MSDFYNILAKHFSNEATASEEAQVLQFKKENSIEYKALKQLWEANGKSIEVVDFDTEKALKKIEKQLETKQKIKVIPLFSSFRKIAAAVVLFIATSTIGYMVFNNVMENTMITAINNTNTEKGKKVLLADGSIVWLNKNATLSFPKTFKNAKREVKLKGEAFFEVSKDTSKPFIITINDTEVTVLGTSFNIKQDSLQTKVTVTTGKVNVMATKINKSVVVIPGFTAEVSTNNLNHFSTKNKNYLSWKTGVFEFNETPLLQVIKDLNTYYETKLEIDTDSTITCPLTTKFNNNSISEIIEILTLTCNVEIKKENNIYKIKSK